jgi:hypothetical protein
LLTVVRQRRRRAPGSARVTAAAVSHGYASSVHKSQGATVDRTFVLASQGMDAKLAYVSMSRQREDVKLYANKTEFKDSAHLKNLLARDGGREAFKSVRDIGEARGKGKESALTRADTNHTMNREDQGQRQRQGEREDKVQQEVGGKGHNHANSELGAGKEKGSSKQMSKESSSTKEKGSSKPKGYGL